MSKPMPQAKNEPCVWDDVTQQNQLFFGVLSKIHGISKQLASHPENMNFTKELSVLVSKQAAICKLHGQIGVKEHAAGEVVSEADFPAYYKQFTEISTLIAELDKVANELQAIMTRLEN